ncbi:hypothetical protein [Christensenella tenuis]|uniref:Uncharacterized protein n=1 Tax=Christensenella tenuis TaxID=2763033 RepID=A0ABR7EHF2_9FIRM|nr:hypothetical protein [Christensenella tenuis]MBC5649118.1 hypothetical protein [Christensenella tenuis]
MTGVPHIFALKKAAFLFCPESSLFSFYHFSAQFKLQRLVLFFLPCRAKAKFQAKFEMWQTRYVRTALPLAQ